MGTEHAGFEYWRKTLGGARFVVAPMVDASELAWRMLSRKYGAELCYTPMLHSSVFINDARYRRDYLESCEQDRPLIVQFCANDPDVFSKACELASPFCDGIDLNLGCPQAIARKGHYGAFLMDEWALIKTMIEKAKESCSVPISAKIRIFPELQKTIEYARMLESAGVAILTVHGRTREQKGALTGLANWEFIKAVRQSVSVPVFANGNIQYLRDVEQCLESTGAQGVMTAEGNLHNPALFTGESPLVCNVSMEYLELAKKYPCPLSFSRGHIFKLMHHLFNLSENSDIRYRMSKASSLDIMMELTKEMEERMKPYVLGVKELDWQNDSSSKAVKLPLPPWVCQPYVRPPPGDKESQSVEKTDNLKRRLQLDPENPLYKGLSRKKLKKMEKNPFKKFNPQVVSYEKCPCSNPMGSRCSFSMCKTCCKFKCHLENLSCPGHKLRKKPNSSTETEPPLDGNSNDTHKAHQESKNNEVNGRMEKTNIDSKSEITFNEFASSTNITNSGNGSSFNGTNSDISDFNDIDKDVVCDNSQMSKVKSIQEESKS